MTAPLVVQYYLDPQIALANEAEILAVWISNSIRLIRPLSSNLLLLEAFSLLRYIRKKACEKKTKR